MSSRGAAAAVSRRGAVAAVGVAAIALAACGSHASGGGPVGKYGPASSPAAVSRCMRANGLTNFPDPNNGSGGVGFSGGLGIGSDGSLVVDGVRFAGPALKTAEQACKIYLPPGGPPPQPSASQRAQALAVARCMRAHGVPDFPDPTFGSATPAKLPSIAESNSPAFKAAAKVCNGGRLEFSG